MTELIIGIVVAIVGGIVVEFFKIYLIEKKRGEIVPEIQIKQVEITRTIPASPSGVICAKCKSINNYDSRFCINCGYVLYETCPNCNHVKPVIEHRCSSCGKDPKELGWIDYYLDKLKIKAVWIGVATLALFIRIISLSNTPNWIDGISIPLATIASFFISLESSQELEWLWTSKLRNFRDEWIENSVKNYDISFWVFAGAGFLNIFWAALALRKIITWIAN